MKRLGQWVNLILKQKGRQLSFWLLLAFLFLLLLLWQRQSIEPMEGVQISIYLEPPTDAAETAEAWQKQLRQRIQEQLTDEAADTLFHMTLETDADDCRDKVAKGQAECGFLIPYDIGVTMINGTFGKDAVPVTVYQSPSSSLTPIVQERIYAILFEAYAGEIFARYAAETPALKTEEATAWEAYRKHLGDGSTFHFTYESVQTEPDGETEVTAGENAKTSLPDTRVVYGFFLYFMLWIGLLDCCRDKEQCRYYFSGQPIACFFARSAEMLLPVGLTLLVGGVLQLGNRQSGVAISQILLYVLILWGYGWVLQLLFPRRQWLTAAMPVLLLATLLFSPVLIDLSDYIPALTILQKCFPLTWWIRCG